jgi:hypothetical protein
VAVNRRLTSHGPVKLYTRQIIYRHVGALFGTGLTSHGPVKLYTGMWGLSLVQVVALDCTLTSTCVKMPGRGIQSKGVNGLAGECKGRNLMGEFWVRGNYEVNWGDFGLERWFLIRNKSVVLFFLTEQLELFAHLTQSGTIRINTWHNKASARSSI